MNDKTAAAPSLTVIDRAERQRLAAEEGALAMAEIERQAIAVRANMERLRALREAKQAEDARIRAALPLSTGRKQKRAAAR